MLSISSLVAKLQLDYPAYTFKTGDDFRWSPVDSTIYYSTTGNEAAAALHELAHAQLGHDTYTKDIQLIEMERDAWTYAQATLAQQYEMQITDDTIQDSLDTYRDWLHSRSTCPKCQATGLQTANKAYRCILCSTTWRVNDARTCALRRYTN